MARSIDQGEGCLWETEDAPTFFPKKNKNSIHADASPNILMDVFPADTTICAGQSVQFSVSGIDPSFSYEWSATDGSFDDIHSPTPTYTILTAGTYAVIVIISDQNNNNIGFFNTSVTVSPPITVAINTSGEDCGQLGSINLTLSGGSGNFTIDWEDLAGTNDMEDRNNLTAGTYTVNVSDDNGCLQTNNIVVPLLCNNACAANAGTITPDEGFLCVPGSFATISATPDGNMTVPSGFAVAYFLTKGANSLIVQTSGNPSFIVTTSGAYTIHTFVYDPATFDINSIILDTTTLNEVNTQLMQGGGGICGALDTNGATTLTEKAVGFVVTSTPETCDAEDGQVILAPVSNSFLWEDGFMGNERNDLANGNYSITVSQTSGCTGEINVTVDEVCQCPVPPTVNNIVVFEATCGNANGSATIEMIGNNNDYTYQWQPNVSTSNVATNLPSGSYSVLITNANDATCFAVENFVIGNSDGPDVQI
ncbi:MAG TPA: hypothetical protein ENJ53_11270, partial [Phaeodactylibacter sp.]|nr:hypothetical protein [Phaeodactylibacter sp.]